MDKDNNKVLLNYLYTEKLVNLGKNFFGITWRIQTLHNKIYPKPEVATEMSKYIQEQVYNGNYIEVDPYIARQEGHQIHLTTLWSPPLVPLPSLE